MEDAEEIVNIEEVEEGEDEEDENGEKRVLLRDLIGCLSIVVLPLVFVCGYIGFCLKLAIIVSIFSGLSYWAIGRPLGKPG